MAAFQYQALDSGGKTKKGTLSADSVRVAKRQLLESGLTPLSIETIGSVEETHSSSNGRISKQEVVLITRQLAILINASMPVEEALEAIAAQMRKPAIRSVLLATRSRVMEGWRLSNALSEHPKVFSKLYCGIVASGETGGSLGKVLSRLADMLEKNRAMIMKAITALVYPAALIIIATITVSGLLVFVIPKIVEQFDAMQAQLPAITSIVIAISFFLQSWGGRLLVVFGLLCVGIWRLLALPKFKLRIDQLLLRLPLIGRLLSGLDAARFARTMSTLFASGVPLLDCLHAAKKTVVNSHIQQNLTESIVMVREGAALSTSMRRVSDFPSMMSYMIAAGERSRKLPEMLENAALQMEEEFDTKTNLALRLIEPIIIVGMGGVIMTIMLAILVPVLQLNTLNF